MCATWASEETRMPNKLCLLRLGLILLLLVISSAASSSSHACYEGDRESLLSFARDAGFSFRDLGWNGDNCCYWEGVICTNISTYSLPRVSKLGLAPIAKLVTDVDDDYDSLASTNGPFQFPPSLCNLSALSSLELFIESTAVKEQQPPLQFPHCPTTSLLPLLNTFSFSLALADGSLSSFLDFSSITTFSNLQFLDLEYIQFDNQSLLASFTRMSPSLVSLSLWSCSAGPSASLRALLTLPFPNLTALWLYSCSLSGPLPAFTSMPLLESLYLRYNLLNSTLEDFTLFSNLPVLKFLHLSENSLSGSLPASTISHRFPTLEALHLSYNNLSGTLPDHTLSLQNLTTLSLSSNQFSGPFPAIDAPLLENLYLSDNHFTGALPKDWQLLQRLQKLILSRTTILAASEDVLGTPRRLPEWLFKLPGLSDLDLSYTGLQATDCECEGMLSLLNQTLEYVDLRGNNLTGPGILDCFAHHNFSQLQGIELSSNPLAFPLSTSYWVQRPFQFFSLRLNNCSLWGSFPIQLSCHGSEYLDLSFNNFTSVKGLAEDCGLNGSTLLSLDLSHNQLRGQNLSWLSTQTLPLIERVILNDNSLEGNIPFELGAATSKLKTLKLSNNRLTGTIPSSICHITSLQLLDLSANQLEGDFNKLFSSLKHRTNLRALLLSHNQINGSIPPFFGALTPSLQIVDLSNNKLSGAIPTNLQLPVLLIAREVHRTKFASYRLNEEVQIVVNGITATFQYEQVVLTLLDVSNNLLGGTIPAQLGKFVGLRHLNLSNNNLSGSIPENLSNLRVLESMDLSSNQLQGQIPSTFSRLKSLGTFDVSFNRALEGPIPKGSPFENNQSFRDDVGLCGEFVLKACIQGTTSTSKREGDSNKHRNTFFSIIQNWVGVPGLCLGFVVGFVGALWALHARSSPFKNVLRLKLQL